MACTGRPIPFARRAVEGADPLADLRYAILITDWFPLARRRLGERAGELRLCDPGSGSLIQRSALASSAFASYLSCYVVVFVWQVRGDSRATSGDCYNRDYNRGVDVRAAGREQRCSPGGPFRCEKRREVGVLELRDGSGLISGQQVRAARPRSDRSLLFSATETAETLYKTPALVSHRVRCGKPTCRCATGEGHGPYTFLYWREGQKQHRRYVPAAEVEAVQVIVEARRAAEQAERLVLGQSLETWREIQQWVRDLETTSQR